MSKDLADLRKRAMAQAKYGNYWAGRCAYLVDLLDSVTTNLEEEIEALKADLAYHEETL